MRTPIEKLDFLEDSEMLLKNLNIIYIIINIKKELSTENHNLEMNSQ